MSDAEQVYSSPAHALDAARQTLSSSTATHTERAEALWVLGRTAYYANRMSDAVRLLRDAVPLVGDAAMLTELLLTLAPALSKEGHPEEALQMLANPAFELEPKYAGQLRNQRGIILTELGRLPEALSQLEDALELLRQAGDANRESRTLVNLGAVASMMGHLDEAERWYAIARDKTIATGQHVVAAGIEGNLGYVESRRGNFAAALAWYRRARASFEALGDVDLLVAVLEVDHARTLLDVGLVTDAVEAAGRAARSATTGGNQMLETQARLLMAEALIRLGEHGAADEALRRGTELARRLGQRAWELRAAYLRSDLGSDSGGNRGAESDGELEIDEFLRAGWVREAYESALQRARHVRTQDAARARDLLVSAEERTKGLDVDPVARALGALLIADIADDAAGADEAFGHALDALSEQRDLLGSAEMRATIAQRLLPIRDAALSVALRLDQPADVVLDVLERTRAVRDARTDDGGLSRGDAEQLARLRNARVAMNEVKLEGGDVTAATETVRSIERDILDHRRSISRPRSQRGHRTIHDELPTGTVFVTFAVHERRLLGITNSGGVTRITDLGRLDPLMPRVRAQRSALRRLADERRQRPEEELERLTHANIELDALLLDPLGLAPFERVVLTPAALLRDIAWTALPSLQQRPVTLVPTLAAWNSDGGTITVRRIAVVGGPGLAADTNELDGIARTWQQRASVVRRATCDEAIHALTTADLVHVAAHGLFRADNPFFSSLVFADGDLSLLEISELDALPAIVVLSSCEAAAAAAPGGGDDMVVGTATELRHLGARIVIAPSVAVNDAAAGQMSVVLHRALASGVAVDEAVMRARRALIETGDPRRIAVALAFHLFGGRATREPLDRDGSA